MADKKYKIAYIIVVVYIKIAYYYIIVEILYIKFKLLIKSLHNQSIKA